MKRRDNRISDKTGAAVSGMRKHKTKAAGRRVRTALCMAAAGVLLSGCGFSREDGYTRKELENLARLEVYEAGSDTLLKTVEDEETLYRYLQAEVFSGDAFESESEKEPEEIPEAPEIPETPGSEDEAYYLVAYKYPAAKFGEQEPKKTYTTVLYRDTDIAKLVVEDESVIHIALPEELLTFYYRMSEEEQRFYESLLSETDGAGLSVAP